MPKKKKGKKKKEEEPIIDEKFQKMTTEELETFIKDTEQKLLKLQQDRNYVQLERVFLLYI